MTTVASEVLASPLPNLPMLRKTPPATAGGSVGGVPPGTRRDSSSNDGPSMHGVAGMGMGLGIGGTSGATDGEARDGLSPTPTVASAWAAKRKADWQGLEVCLLFFQRRGEERRGESTSKGFHERRGGERDHDDCEECVDGHEENG